MVHWCFLMTREAGDIQSSKESQTLSPLAFARRCCVVCLLLIVVVWLGMWGMHYVDLWRSIHPPRIEIADRRIAFYGTEEYTAKAAQFSLTATQARDRAFQWQKQKSGSIPGHHRMIVNDEYVFSDLCKLGVSLSGYYVDGNTGEVRRVYDQFIPTGQARELGSTGKSAIFESEGTKGEQKHR